MEKDKSKIFSGTWFICAAGMASSSCVGIFTISLLGYILPEMSTLNILKLSVSAFGATFFFFMALASMTEYLAKKKKPECPCQQNQGTPHPEDHAG